jgi:hypothetical protein
MVLLILFLGILNSTLSQELGHKTEIRISDSAINPFWKFDLRPVGYTEFTPNQDTGAIHVQPNALCFSGNTTLISTFMTGEDYPTLKRRDDPRNKLPFRLHGIILHVGASEVQATKEWQVARPLGGIVASGDGNFTVITSEMIALYSSNVELLRNLTFSPDERAHLWDFYPSPTGKTILVEYHYPDASFQWIDVNLLQPKPIWSDSLPVRSISDAALTYSRSTLKGSRSPTIHEVFIRSKDGSERVVCRVPAEKVDGCGYPQFLSDDSLALWMPHGLEVMPRTGGTTLISSKFGENDWVGPILYPSAGGKRFAITVWVQKGGNDRLDRSSHNVLKNIIVFDISSGKAVLRLDLADRKIGDISGLALSPDGSLLALLVDGVVEVYQLSTP